jgi:anti-anti-sigma factor
VILTFLPGLTSASESLERAKDVFLATGQSPEVVLNLKYIPFMSSTFINMLLAVNRLLRPDGKALRVFGLHPDLAEIFRVTKIHTLFDIYDDEPSALAGPARTALQAPDGAVQA